MFENRITRLFNIQYPIIQGGMIWCSGWELAAAVSNAGGLGLLGAGSMSPEILREHIIKTKKATDKVFGVNIPLIHTFADDCIKVIMEEKVNVVFTSAGNPKKWTSTLKENEHTVVHVVSNSKFALKSQDAGVDAVVAEGFEAGGHNGREETTTLVLIPKIAKELRIPLIAAGGIGCGKSMAATMILGAEGVQIGTRFITSNESSASDSFKEIIVNANEGDTMLTLKQLMPVRLYKNKFFHEIQEKQLSGISNDELLKILGSGRPKKGMFESNVDEGELEIGQVSGTIDKIMPVKEIIDTIVQEYMETISKLNKQ
jgi:enoyl-[acyl-carrier protein] reductase II